MINIIHQSLEIKINININLIIQELFNIHI